MIVCTNLTKRFPPEGHGVIEVSLTVGGGDSYALLGANGAGKTTLLNLLLGYLPPDTGSITVGGVDVRRDPVAAKRALAYVPEVAALYAHLSAIENMRFFDVLLGNPVSEDEQLALLAQMNFPLRQARQPVARYSKGMRQKTALAIGLRKGADVFLLDEPFSGLDPASREEFSATIADLRHRGKSILFTSHDLGGIMTTATRVGVLTGGRLTVDEPLEAFRQRDARAIYRSPSDDAL